MILVTIVLMTNNGVNLMTKQTLPNWKNVLKLIYLFIHNLFSVALNLHKIILNADLKNLTSNILKAKSYF